VTSTFADAGASTLFVSVEAIMQHPRFGQAAGRLADGLANLYGDDRRLVRNMFEYVRPVTFMIAICVDANQRDDDPATWLTVATLADAAAKMGIGPLRRVRRLVDEMRTDGMLLTEIMPGDRRRHRLRPSARMLELDREWIATFHAPLLEMVPDEPRFQRAVARDPSYQQRFRQVGLTTLSMANQVMVQNPAVDLFLGHAAGARVLAILIQAARADPEGWTAPGFYSMAAARSATTRVHVRDVIRAAAEASLVEVGPDADGRVRVKPALRLGFERWAADALLGIEVVSAQV